MTEAGVSITDRLIDFADADADPDALAMMRLSLFDWAVCGIAGAADPGFAGFRRTVAASGGRPEAVLLGGGAAPAASAALINGTLSHALDCDDTHFAHIGHPSVAVVPAVLALASRADASFEHMLTAALIGVEASVHVGLWLGRDHYQIGFHQTATAGAFGATLAAARLLGLAPQHTRHALGLCASLASGLKAQFGTGGKPMNAGLAARSGVEAALWAQSGLTAAADGLAGPLGFGETHHGGGHTEHLERLGRSPWQITSISHKFHACCHGLHAMLEAIPELHLAPDNIQTVEISTHPRWMTVCNQPDPDTGLAAKFSYRHTAVMGFCGLNTGEPGNFSDQLARDPQLTSIRDRIDVVADSTLTELQCRISAVTVSGQTRTAFHDLATPMTLTTRRDKLRAKASAFLGAAQADALWRSVDTSDLAGFLSALQGSEGGADQP